MSKEHKEFCNNKRMKKNCPLRLHTRAVAAERAIQTLKNWIIANLEDNIGFTESINLNLALRVMGFTIHTRLKVGPYGLHHGIKARTELTYVGKDNES